MIKVQKSIRYNEKRSDKCADKEEMLCHYANK